MTLPPYSRRREEELRRRSEEGEARRKRIEEELAQAEQQNQEIQPAATIDGSTLEAKMEQLRQKYFVKGAVIGGLVGAMGGAAFGYAMDRYQGNQLVQSFPQEAAFQYKNTVVTSLLCTALGASIGALVALPWYGRKKMEKGDREHTEGEEQKGGRT